MGYRSFRHRLRPGNRRRAFHWLRSGSRLRSSLAWLRNGSGLGLDFLTQLLRSLADFRSSRGASLCRRTRFGYGPVHFRTLILRLVLKSLILRLLVL